MIKITSVKNILESYNKAEEYIKQTKNMFNGLTANINQFIEEKSNKYKLSDFGFDVPFCDLDSTSILSNDLFYLYFNITIEDMDKIIDVFKDYLVTADNLVLSRYVPLIGVTFHFDCSLNIKVCEIKFKNHFPVQYYKILKNNFSNFEKSIINKSLYDGIEGFIRDVSNIKSIIKLENIIDKF